MPYESRHGNTKRGARFRHDPAFAGIFIHGGTVCAGPFYRGNANPNDFGFTIPTRNPADEVIDQQKLGLQTYERRQPTFQRAVDEARRIREQFPILKDCPIYACTDLQMDTPHSGHWMLQRVA